MKNLGPGIGTAGIWVGVAYLSNNCVSPHTLGIAIVAMFATAAAVWLFS